MSCAWGAQHSAEGQWAQGNRRGLDDMVQVRRRSRTRFAELATCRSGLHCERCSRSSRAMVRPHRIDELTLVRITRRQVVR